MMHVYDFLIPARQYFKYNYLKVITASFPQQTPIINGKTGKNNIYITPNA